MHFNKMQCCKQANTTGGGKKGARHDECMQSTLYIYIYIYITRYVIQMVQTTIYEINRTRF